MYLQEVDTRLECGDEWRRHGVLLHRCKRLNQPPVAMMVVGRFKYLYLILIFMTCPTGAAGFVVSFDRIATKLCFHTPVRSTFMFFVLSILILFIHSTLHHLAMKNPLVQHYVRITTESKQKRRILLHLNPNEDATLVIKNYVSIMSYLCFFHNIYVLIVGKQFCFWLYWIAP